MLHIQKFITKNVFANILALGGANPKGLECDVQHSGHP